MRAQYRSTMRLTAVLLASAALGLAQTSSYESHNSQNTAYAPAQPGALNYVEGEASLEGQPLSYRSVGSVIVMPGQDLKTGNGYAELLLTPGTFLRLGQGSEIRVESAGLANTHIRFLHGTGLLEVDQLINGTDLSVEMGRDSAQVLKKGLYDFDDAGQAMRVLDGKLKIVAPSNTKEIGKNDQVLLENGDTVKKTDFSSKLIKDTPLYTWSEARSRFESQENMAAAQNANFYTAAGTGWFWDPYAHFYGFWPTSAYLYSPFGFSFYGGYYGRPLYYRSGLRAGYRGVYYGHVGGVSAHVSGFHAGGGHR